MPLGRPPTWTPTNPSEGTCRMRDVPSIVWIAGEAKAGSLRPSDSHRPEDGLYVMSKGQIMAWPEPGGTEAVSSKANAAAVRIIAQCVECNVLLCCVVPRCVGIARCVRMWLRVAKK